MIVYLQELEHSLTDNSKCSICDGTDSITDLYTREVVCANCGCVISNISMTTGFDFRAYDTSERDSRNRFGEGYKHSSFDRGINTYIGGRKDANGNNLPSETQNNMTRLRRRDNRTKINESSARNLLVAMSELDRIISELHLSNPVKEQSAVLYRRALKEKLIRGRSIDAFIAASIYAACRMLGVPRTLDEVSVASKREKGEVGRSYRIMLRDLDLKPPIDKPFKFLSKAAHDAGLPGYIEQEAVSILKDATEIHIVQGKDPRGLAAGALYYACELHDFKVTQGNIADAAGISHITLRNRWKGLKEGLKR